MSGDNKLMSVAEAAAFMNKSEVTVKRWARESLIQSTKQNGEFMFEKSALVKYLEIEKRLN